MPVNISTLVNGDRFDFVSGSQTEVVVSESGALAAGNSVATFAISN